MPVVLNAWTSSSGSANPKTIAAFTVDSGDTLLIVGTQNRYLAGGSVTGVTWNGVALTLLGTVTQATHRQEIWYLLSPTPGTGDVVITHTTAPSGSSRYSVRTATGSHASSPFGPVATAASGSGTSSSITITSEVDEVAFDLMGSSQSGGTHTANGGGQTADFLNNGGGSTQFYYSASQKPGAATSITMGYTWASTANRSQIGVSVKPAPSGGVSRTDVTIRILA